MIVNSNSADIFVDEEINSVVYFVDDNCPSSKQSTDIQNQSKTKNTAESIPERTFFSESDVSAGFSAILQFWKSLPSKSRENLMISFNGEFLSFSDLVLPSSSSSFLKQTSLTSSSIASPYSSTKTSSVSTSSTPANYKPTYCYRNNPLEGWTFCIDVYIEPDGNTQSTSSTIFQNGQTTVYYKPPNYAEIRNKRDLECYIRSNSLPYRVRKHIDFGSVFCVCHTPEDLSRNYIECSYGLTGCFGWVSFAD